MHPDLSTAGDWAWLVDHHWFIIVTSMGAVAATAGVVAGSVLAALYGRRASASLTATASTGDLHVVLAARPVVRAVGIFRVKFHPERGARVRVQEVYIDDSGDLKLAERRWDKTTGWERQQYVDAGEELTTTVVFRLPLPTLRVVGWQVFLNVDAPRRRTAPGATSAWSDQVFVPRAGLQQS